MTRQDAIVKGLHSDACERSAKGRHLFHYQRLLMLVTTHKGKPRYGERFAVADLGLALGLAPEMVYHAVRDLRDKGVNLLTERPYPTAGGQYFFAKTEEEALAAIDARRREVRGGVAVLRNLVESASEDFPALTGQAPMLITDSVLAQIGGEIALQTARRLAAGEEARHALPAASA